MVDFENITYVGNIPGYYYAYVCHVRVHNFRGMFQYLERIFAPSFSKEQTKWIGNGTCMFTSLGLTFTFLKI